MRVYWGSRLTSETSSPIEVKNVDIFLFCSQSLLRSSANKVIRVSVSLEFSGMGFFPFCIGLTICFPCFCFSSAIFFEVGSIEVLVFVIGFTICSARI